MAGGSAEVYRARRADGTVAAVKVATLSEVVERELALLARLQRQRGPRLLDAGRGADGRVYIATTWVNGAPLVGPLPELDAWGVARDVARDLAELHEARLFHGDVKGANVLRGEGAAAESVLIDLGLAGRVGEPATGGTPRYMAPEARRGSPLLPAADLFSLGILLGELIVPGASAAEDPVALLRAAPPSTPLRHLVSALLAESPGGRPSARTVVELATRALGGPPTSPSDDAASREISVRRTYLALREPELLPHRSLDESLQGAPREWLAEVLGWMARVASGAAGDPLPPLLPLGPYARSRWLVALAGEVGASLVFAGTSEAALAAQLTRLARALPPSAWTQADVSGETRDDGALPPGRPRGDWLGLQRALLGGGIGADELRFIEDDPAIPEALRITLAEVLLRRGEPGRAFVALYGARGPEAALLGGDLARRRGDVAGARALLEPLVDDPRHGSGARATLARIAWDRRDLSAARALLTNARGPRADEVRALVHYAEGHPEAAIPVLEVALAGPRDSFERARLLGVRGMLEHALGESARSAATFTRAAELAREARSVVDEATYLTGLAAAASDAGQVGNALGAATRAALLWERLEQRSQAARALLARTNALLTIGLTGEATEAAQLARRAGREGGDAVAEGYACLAEIDARLDGGDDARAAFGELLARAEATVGSEEGGLRVLARRARLRRLDASELREGDVLAASAPPSAQWEWWFARAEGARPEEAASIVVGVVALASDAGSLGLRGPTLARVAELAAARGELDVFRRLERARHEAAMALRQGVPPELQGALGSLRWMQQSGAAQGTLSEEQVADLAHVVRVMSGRDSLSQLFTQALDTMLLWTSAERGMVLTRAGERLVIRAARNLGRRDMVGDQLALSHGLARRALETGEPTLATDALATMGNLHASVHALRLRSVLAVPLLARGEALGVVYLDDRTRRGIFGERELAWVRLVASQAAVAIADARDQVLLRRAVRRAERAGAEVRRLLQERDAELSATKSALVRVSRETRFAYDAIRGSSPRIREMLHLVDRVTDSDVPVLVEGESGTGKELVAKAIHGNGLRAKKPFVSENCASLPEGLLESTLFGHVRGAFTGATGSRIGLFEVADGGTLFLDEIGEMSAGLQAKLLRALQEGEIRPVGSERTRKVDVRVIGATHRDLAAMVEKGAFREDLFYRLNVVSIRVPPLRERSEDIPDLVQHFLKKYAEGKTVRVTKAALGALTEFSWPGNVRQLENEVRRALVLGGDRIDVGELSFAGRKAGAPPPQERFDLRGRVDALERTLLGEALAETRGNQTRAAELLGLSRFGLTKMLKRLGVAVP